MNLERVIAVRTNKIVYRDGETVVKVFDEEFKKADVLNEALGHARMEQTDLNVPKLYEVGMLDGKWFLQTEFIRGKTLARLMKEQPDRYAEYLRMFVELQILVHMQSSPLLSRLSDRLHRQIDATAYEATVRYDLHMRVENLPKKNQVCHGDFNPTNVILRESDGAPFLIDWSHVSQGNACADAARTCLFFRLADGIDHAMAYLTLFCQLSGTTRADVEKWIPIVAACQSDACRKEETGLFSGVNAPTAAADFREIIDSIMNKEKAQ